MYRKISLLLSSLFLLCAVTINAQNIGINNPTPDASAILDLLSINKGFLAPRMTSAQRIAIPAPANGLLVYDTTVNTFFYFNGTLWINLATGPSGWGLTGNAGTNATTNYIGTSDAQDLAFRVNNIQKMKLLLSGRLELYGAVSDSSSVAIGKNAGNLNSSSSNVFIGKNSGRLNTFGSLNTFIGHESGLNNNTGGTNTFVGAAAGKSNLSGQANTFIGSAAGVNVTTGYQNTFVGSNAGASITTSNTLSIFGSNAGMNLTTGNGSSIFGANAGQALTTGIANSIFGETAGYSLINGGFNAFFGYQSGGVATTGGGNSYFGAVSGAANTTGTNNTFIGSFTGFTNTTGQNNSTLGYQSNFGSSGLFNSTAIGAFSQVNSSNSIVLGAVAGVNMATTTSRVGIGTNSPTERLHVVGNIRVEDGNQAAGKILMSDANGTATWTSPGTATSGSLDNAYDFGGAGAGRMITADAGAVLINGKDGLVSTGTLDSGVVVPSGDGVRMVWNPKTAAFRVGRVTVDQWDPFQIGEGSFASGLNTKAAATNSTAMGENTTASGIGSTALGSNTHANFDYSTSMGLNTIALSGMSTAMGNSTQAFGTSSTAMGSFTLASGQQSTSMGQNTTASGDRSISMGEFTTASGRVSAAMGSENVASGAISTVAGYRNTASSFGETVMGIGATTYVPSLNGDSQFRIANATDRLFVVGNAIDSNSNNILESAELSNALVILKNGNTGFGSSTPATRLHVVGNIRMVDGNQAAGKALISDANGTATWQTLSGTLSNSWGLTGNTGTSAATNFIGTTDSVDLVLRTNNIDKFRFKADGRLEIGNQSTNPLYNSAVGGAPKLFVASENLDNNIVLQASNSTGNPVSLHFGLSRGTTLTPTITQPIENLGNIYFSGYDGTKFVSSARINVTLDGVPGTNDMPGRIDFSTTPDGQSTPISRLVIRSTGNIGIGTPNPTQKLHVTDTVRIEDGNQALNKVLTSDANGNGTWQTLDPSKTNAWGLTGNSGTNPATNFVGTTDSVNLVFRTKNIERARVSAIGTMGIGVAAVGTNFVNPFSSFEIFGDGVTKGDVTLHNAGSNAFGNFIVNLKSRGTHSAPLAVSNGDRIATYSAYAFDGTKFGSILSVQHAAFMSMEMDATPGLNDLPTRITFGTTADGSLSAVERMRITNAGNVGIGTTAPTQKLQVNDTIRIVDGNQALNKVLTSDANGNGTWQTLNTLQTNAWGLTGNAGTNDTINFIGTTDNQDVVIKQNNIVAGRLSGLNTSWGTDANPLNSGGSNTAVGNSALSDLLVGIQNTAVGSLALLNTTNASGNTAVGQAVLSFNQTGNDNTAMGTQAMRQNLSGDDNVALGRTALVQNTTGSKNVAIGELSLGSNTTGSLNTGLGARASVLSGNLSNATAIGSYAAVDTGNAMVLGSINGINGGTANVNVGIGTTKPKHTFHVVNNNAGDGGFANSIVVENTNASTGEAAISFKNTATASNYWISGLNQNDDLTFAYGTAFTSAATVLAVTAEGNVGVNNITPVSKLETNGSFGAAITTTTTSLTLNETHHTVIITGGTPVIALPAPATCNRRIYVLVNHTATVRTLSLYLTSLNGGATGSIPAQGSMTIQSNGTNWYQIQ